MFKLNQLLNGRFNIKNIKSIINFQFKMPKKPFCQFTEVDDINIFPNYERFKNSDLSLEKFTLCLVKYLEKTQNLHNQLNQESMALNEDLFDNPNKDFLKNQLVRINKQISSYSKELYYYDEVLSILNNLMTEKVLLKEAEELKDEEIKKFAKSEIEQLYLKLEELEKNVIESLLPEEEVI